MTDQTDQMTQAVSDLVNIIVLGVIGIITIFVKDYFERRRLAKVEANLQAATDDQNKRLDAVAGKVETVAAKVETVHTATNGLTQVIAAAKLAQGTAEGVVLGLQQAHDEAQAKDKPPVL